MTLNASNWRDSNCDKCGKAKCGWGTSWVISCEACGDTTCATCHNNSGGCRKCGAVGRKHRINDFPPFARV